MMATDERTSSRIDVEPPPSVRSADGPGETNFGELFRDLAGETTQLFRQEVTLAKLEVKETATHAAADLGKMAAAAVLALLGAMALTAFLIALIGTLLGGAYWAGALIVGIIYLAIAGVIGVQAKNDLKRIDPKPEQTLETLREDKRWAENEAREVKRDVRR